MATFRNQALMDSKSFCIFEHDCFKRQEFKQMRLICHNCRLPNLVFSRIRVLLNFCDTFHRSLNFYSAGRKKMNSLEISIEKFGRKKPNFRAFITYFSRSSQFFYFFFRVTHFLFVL